MHMAIFKVSDIVNTN